MFVSKKKYESMERHIKMLKDTNDRYFERWTESLDALQAAKKDNAELKEKIEDLTPKIKEYDVGRIHAKVEMVSGTTHDVIFNGKLGLRQLGWAPEDYRVFSITAKELMDRPFSIYSTRNELLKENHIVSIHPVKEEENIKKVLVIGKREYVLDEVEVEKC